MMSQFMIGCDPEVFAYDTLTDSMICADGIGVTGTKYAPQAVEGGAVQVDGMALEFNTDPMALSALNVEAFDKATQAVMSRLDAMTPPNIALVPKSYAEFTEAVWEGSPERAKELGCDPDYCAWEGGRQNPAPDRGGKLFSTGAGHIHVGFVEPGEEIDYRGESHMTLCCEAVKIMDLFVGTYMVLIEADDRRRGLYGKAGAFRPKPYGFEYRTPSNEWLRRPEYRRDIYRLVYMAVETMRAGDTLDDITTWGFEFENNIRENIDRGDWERSRKYLRKAFMWSSCNEFSFEDLEGINR